jgi:hypothetical protein
MSGAALTKPILAEISESEKRAVTGIVLPSNRAALLHTAASGDALNLPSTTTPLA